VSAITKRDAIDAAMSVAEDVAESRLDPAQLDQAVADECRDLFGTVVGDGDPLWELHTDVARQAIALGALSANELQEWLAVARSRAAEPMSAPATPEPPIEAPAGTSVASEAIGPETDLLEPDPDGSDEINLSDSGEPEPQLEQAAPATDANTPAMVELPDGRRIPRRLIAARGFGHPMDDGLLPL
jgi:hypothetical protein